MLRQVRQSLFATSNRHLLRARQTPGFNTLKVATMATLESHNPPSNKTPEFDEVIQRIAKYVHNYEIKSDLAFSTARYCLIDTIGCGLEALHHKECTKMLGPLTEGTTVTKGAKVPGTTYELDPVEAARNFGTMIRWLDFNDTVGRLLCKETQQLTIIVACSRMGTPLR